MKYSNTITSFLFIFLILFKLPVEASDYRNEFVHANNLYSKKQKWKALKLNDLPYTHILREFV